MQNSDPDWAFSVLNVACLYIQMVGEFKFKGKYIRTTVWNAHVLLK